MLVIRPMTTADVPEGMRLKAEAGWNQVLADWERFLALDAEGCFVAESGGRVVGSATSCRFGSVAWIAMLLVEKARRREGIGGRLLRHAIDRLESLGARSIRLDATQEGRPLYESLGFGVDFRLDRYSGILSGAALPVDTRIAESVDVAEIARLDRSATETDRRILIERLIHDHPAQYLVSHPIHGFVLWRSGSSAVQVGPCIAARDVGRVLLGEAARRLAGRGVVVDIPAENVAAVAWAEAACLKPSRAFWRMTRGEPVVEDQSRLWASSGPEMG